MTRNILVAALTMCVVFVPVSTGAQSIETPKAFFGFEPGTDGEMARYPKVLQYLQHIAELSDRVSFEEVGKSTMGNPYVLLRISSPENLSRFDRLVEINRRLADPRTLAESEVDGLTREGRPFYLLFATIHSTEVGNGQAVPVIVHRLATGDSPEMREILDNAVLLLVPSQNPDGQVMVIDHWYETKGTGLNRTYPDLYHKYVGHDDNRDWFMFTQVETRLAVDVQNRYKPTIVHDMHQMGSYGARIFVPPFKDPYDRNIHPILIESQARVGLAMADALISSGKTGVVWNEQYDLWTPARQYMLYHGQPRILTEIASANLADPLVSPLGQPFGAQEMRSNFPNPYRGTEWTLGQIVDYGVTAVFGGLTHMAKYRVESLANFYKVHRDWVERDEAPFAFVMPPEQRDPHATYQLLDILETGEVEIQRATAAFRSNGKEYPAGSFVIELAQPYGAFAKTLLEIQHYPDLRYYPGGPPIPPYDVTGHTLGYLLGVDVDQLDEPLRAELEPVTKVAPLPSSMPPRPRWAYLVPPESNAGFLALTRLQKKGVKVFRAATGFESAGRTFAPGTWIVPPGGDATTILGEVAKETGLPVFGAARAPSVEGFRVKAPTRVGLYKVANNMPAGWMMWLFERYELDHQVMSSADFQGELAASYDTIVLPSGTSKERMLNGLSPSENSEKWRWAYGIGEEGWNELRDWVHGGGTLVAIGSSVQTAKELLDLPIEPVLPEAPRRFRRRPEPVDEGPSISRHRAEQMLKDAFQSPAQLAKVLGNNVVDPTSVFFCPGSLLKQLHHTRHPVGFGMPERWPVFFRFDQAYRLRPSFEISAEVVSRYPDEESMVESGWLLGDELLRDQANVVAFRVGNGYVVTLGTQVAFRTQTPATFKLLFNAMYHGPSTKVSARDLARLR